MTEEERRERERAYQRKYRDRKRAEAGKTPRKTYTTEEERKAAHSARQKKWFDRKKQDKEWLERWKADQVDRYRRKNGPPKPRLTEEERRARQKAYRESYVRPEPTTAQKAQWSERARERWAAYYANETEEQRALRLAAKAFYRETEVQPKVREIVEHIKYDFGKANTEVVRQAVADEWADTGLSCWLTAKALWYREVAGVMERYGYEGWDISG
ncbi:hypothetical protein [Rhizobium ruizarguesonis]|uniref:hypothetical protein n=1 Tax=Rhizobium ruizarguesonis TaxID=2081791 RepID=UPI001032538B|nr:hypothetical protein [Rhizobium ruizarguesonis]TAU67471.1 hypothetical protein ELI45_06145 [Rhizobium ruizarguesonis]TAV15145.1 hypothetical protein ELI34_06670 [Rhizobium ruizarguesonis]TAV27603.1 hypothetical protein ELI35_07990 [Rhizobium ruizarguesonis]TAW71577.1 hypothetical protein ELI16_06240 [Rhizobium ruizarguesonis]TAW92973.1 hypothetical protein ELI11_06765 [Rhizobium ruizarguesonis]